MLIFFGSVYLRKRRRHSLVTLRVLWFGIKAVTIGLDILVSKENCKRSRLLIFYELENSNHVPFFIRKYFAGFEF